jgi:hypothetical protein
VVTAFLVCARLSSYGVCGRLNWPSGQADYRMGAAMEAGYGRTCTVAGEWLGAQVAALNLQRLSERFPFGHGFLKLLPVFFQFPGHALGFVGADELQQR